MPVEPIQLTRDELYERVWAEPMSILARQFALSDVGLAKICRKLRVPVPGRGYWQRKGAGQPVRPTPLVKLPASAPASMQKVTIRRASGGLAEAAVDSSGPVADQERFESESANKIQVADVLSSPHPLVERTVLALRRAKTDEQGYLKLTRADCLAVHVTLGTADRAMCIYDALLRALDARKFTVTIRSGESRATVVTIGEEDLSIALEERVDRVEAPPPARAARRASAWSPPQRFEWVGTGRLVLSIEGVWTEGVRRSWGDGKQQRVEACLNRFIVGLVIVAEEVKIRRAEIEERQRAFRAAEERRLAEIRRREEEASRVRALNHAVDCWRDARWIRDFVAAARNAAERTAQVDGAAEFAEWLAWAESYAERLDPLARAPSIPRDPEPNKRLPYNW